MIGQPSPWGNSPSLQLRKITGKVIMEAREDLSLDESGSATRMKKFTGVGGSVQGQPKEPSKRNLLPTAQKSGDSQGPFQVLRDPKEQQNCHHSTLTWDHQCPLSSVTDIWHLHSPDSKSQWFSPVPFKAWGCGYIKRLHPQVVCASASISVVTSPAASAAPGHLLEIQILWPHPRPIGQKFWRRGL